MPNWSGLQKFFGGTVSNAAGYAAGTASAQTLVPYLQEVTNTAWVHAINVPGGEGGLPVDPATVADIVADDPAQVAWGHHEANKSGIPDAAMDRMVTAAQTGPDFGTLLSAWRRDKITDAEFVHGLRKMKLEPEYDAAMKDQKTAYLTPDQVALGIVRGIIPAPPDFALPFQLPAPGGKVPVYPTVTIDAEQEARAWGIDTTRLEALTAYAGRPMSHQEAAFAYFKGIIDRSDYDRAIAEGDTRPEYGPFMLDNAREIPSVTNIVEAYVRNWIKSEPEFLAQTARHGMSDDDAQIMFLIHGRPLTHHQVFIASLRGGVYDGPTDQIDPHFLKSLQESDMRPEWYNMAWAARYNYPPFFQTASALAKGWITAETATEWMTKTGIEPTAIAAIINGITNTGTATKKLTPTQIRQAYHAGNLSVTDALARLETDGYSAADARLFLGNPPPAA